MAPRRANGLIGTACPPRAEPRPPQSLLVRHELVDQCDVLASAAVRVLSAVSCGWDESCWTVTLIRCQLMCAVCVVATSTHERQLSQHKASDVFLLVGCATSMPRAGGSRQHQLSNPVRGCSREHQCCAELRANVHSKYKNLMV